MIALSHAVAVDKSMWIASRKCVGCLHSSPFYVLNLAALTNRIEQKLKVILSSALFKAYFSESCSFAASALSDGIERASCPALKFSIEGNAGPI